MRLSGKNIVLLACGIVLVVYAAILLLAFEKTPILWLELVCGAIALTLVALSCTRGVNGGGKGAFLSYPKAITTSALAIVQLVFGLAACAIPSFPLAIAAIANIVLLAICLVMLVMLAKSSEHIENTDKMGKQSTAFMRDLQLQLADIQAEANEENSQFIEKLIEAARYADPVSSEATQEVEAELQKQVDNLQQGVVSGNDISATTNKINKLIEKRTRVCKASKQ